MELALNSNYVEVEVSMKLGKLFAITATGLGHVPFSVSKPR